MHPKVIENTFPSTTWDIPNRPAFSETWAVQPSDSNRRLVAAIPAEEKTLRTHSKPFYYNDRHEPDRGTMRNPDQENGVLEMLDMMDTKADHL
jgi:hypothetical protein